MAVVRFGVGARDEAEDGVLVKFFCWLGEREKVKGKVEDSPKFHYICLGKDALHGPSCELAAVILHLGCYHCTSLAG